MPAVGLDISDQSIKFAEIAPRRGRLDLARYGEHPLDLGIIEAGEVKSPAALARALAELRVTHHLDYVVASLPEEEAYIVRLELPVLAARDIYGSIELQLEEHVPLPVDKVVFDYDVVSAPTTERPEYTVAVSVLPRDTVAAYSAALAEAGLYLLALEIETQAIARALVPDDDACTTLLVDFGKTRTSFSVLFGGVVQYTSTFNNIGGQDLSASLKKNLNVDEAEAERIKIERGILRARKDKELFSALLPLVSVLRDEIAKQFKYWNENLGRTIGRPIERVLVCGGQSSLPGLAEYLGLSLGVPVTLGDVWRNLFEVGRSKVPPLTRNQSLRYATAIGLALRRVPRQRSAHG